MDRRPDIPPEDQYGTGRGQSYRPGGARERTPPPRGDGYRARSPPRRNDYSDTYRGGRPRTRSPPRRDDYRRRSPSPDRYRERDVRGGGDTYRARPRSPVRREELPRDDLFRRDPVRDTRDYRDYRDDRGYRDERDYAGDRDRGYGGPAPRSPPPRFRDRSPVPLKRGRDPSPMGGRRSPPPPKRGKLDSPRGRYNDYPTSRPQSPPRRGYSPDPRDRRPSPPRAAGRDYRPRSRSPVGRNDRMVDDWRRQRSPSPGRHPRQDYLAAEENGGRDSATTSRRSSPPVHPSRLTQVDDRSGRPTPRDPYDNREPYRARSPRAASPVLREREYADDRDYASNDPPLRDPYRAEDSPAPRAPPTGPAGYRAPSASLAPPTGPSAAASSSRAPAIPPSGPRGGPGPGPGRGDFGAPRGRGGFRGDFGGGRGGFGGAPFRGGRGGGLPFGGRGGPPPGPSYGRSESFDRDREADFGNGPPPGLGNASAGPPSGPRGSFSQASAAPAPALRQGNNSTATTYPRTTRFTSSGQAIPDEPPRRTSTPTGPRSSASYPTNRPHPAIADLPKPIEGGQKAEPLVDRTKLDKLQEEAEKLRKIIEEKEAKKRKGLREWERLGRETDAAAWRSQLAEEALRNVSGEAEGAAAF